MKNQNYYNYESFGQCDLAAPDFHSVANVGSRAPHFTLHSLDGENVSLAEFIGKKHVVLEFGSIT
jgi:peroxiredoxin